MIKLSIIVAAYNVSEFIEDCLNSVIKQCDHKIEILIINDGSTDNTANKINKVLDNKITCSVRVINQKNQGISEVRNRGVREATGEYITFLDGDDVWLDGYINKLSIGDKDEDIIEFDAVRFSSLDELNKGDNYINLVKRNGRYKFSFNRLRETFYNNQWFTWSRVYKKELFNGLEFPKSRRYEDICITPILYFRAKYIYAINTPLIGYRYNDLSITRNPSENDIDDILFALGNVKKHIKNSEMDDLWSISCFSSVPVLKYVYTNSNGNNKRRYINMAFKFIKGQFKIKLLFKYKKKSFLILYLFKMFAFRDYIKKYSS